MRIAKPDICTEADLAMLRHAMSWLEGFAAANTGHTSLPQLSNLNNIYMGITEPSPKGSFNG